MHRGAGLGKRRVARLACAIRHAAGGQPNSLKQGLVHRRRPSWPSRGCRSGCMPGSRAVSVIGHMHISRGVRAPKSEKRYTTPRSDFRFCAEAGHSGATVLELHQLPRVVCAHFTSESPSDTIKSGFSIICRQACYGSVRCVCFAYHISALASRREGMRILKAR